MESLPITLAASFCVSGPPAPSRRLAKTSVSRSPRRNKMSFVVLPVLPASENGWIFNFGTTQSLTHYE